MSRKDKWVRRFSVDETAKHKNGFTIYKITSVLFRIDSPEVMTSVSVWKRYSDARRLRACLEPLRAGLRLRGTLPPLARHGYFSRFRGEVIEERAKAIKALLEFVAEHQLLFTSTDFVNFLQSGYPGPEHTVGVIDSIRAALRLPRAEPAPLEYPDDGSPTGDAHTTQTQPIDEAISKIPVYEATDVELPFKSPSKSPSRLTDSFESIDSLGSITDDLYNELDKVTINKTNPSIKVLPDLINFDVPSTSKFDDYHTMSREDSVSFDSTMSDDKCSSVSVYSRSVASLSNAECKSKTEDSYVFEAGYMLNLATRYEDMAEFPRAFECYKAGIEKMLIGVQSDTDPQRRALIKDKTNKYLAHAETIYRNHLCGIEPSLLPERDDSRSPHRPLPIAMLSRPYEELSVYRVLGVLGSSVVLVLHTGEQACYAMKVIRKVPKNLTEFDEYILQNTVETRQPILPTLIPYMVPIHSYIQTNNLIFLILSYAPGEKLFDYIANYTKSTPNTPAREVNLENVFTEPRNNRTDLRNDNNIDEIEVRQLETDLKLEIDETDSKIDETDSTEPKSILERIEAHSDTRSNGRQFDTIEANIENNNDSSELSVNELVRNSQKLLKDVDKVLSVKGSAVLKVEDERVIGENRGETVKSGGNRVETVNSGDIEVKERRMESPSINRPRGALPPGAVREWGAEMLTALESLHNCGVVCRDLNPSNILLGDRGQILLTYFAGAPGLEMALATLRRGPPPLYVAPELWGRTHVDPDWDPALERVCDFWSFGAIMYELICGVPLSHYHPGAFTAHSALRLPEGLPLESQALLTQLLTYSPAARLGARGVREIKAHPYFRSVDWELVSHSWAPPR